MPEKVSIAINQLGYRPHDHKLAVIAAAQGQYRILSLSTNEIVWQGQTTSSAWDEASGVSVCKLDFSNLTLEGQYRIEGEQGISLPFAISEHVYEETQQALLKAFYYLRCGMELEEKYAGQWTHQACHRTPVHVYGDPEQTFDGSGGWHDAGDYGKYIVAAGKAVADLLLAYELYPQAFQRKLPLPESDELMADVLHEVKYELDWMLKMQHMPSGGVFHKLTTLQFPPLDTMPEADNAALYAMPVSATATASFAAALAMAARIYKPFDSAYASRYLDAAKRAFVWLEDNPSVAGFKNPSDVGTGEYGDETDADERYWAAAELYRTTGEPHYHEVFLQYAAQEEFSKTALGWSDMGGYGTISYLLNEREQDKATASLLTEQWMLHASQLAANCQQDGYGISLLPEQYRWGSNMDVMNNAMTLLLAQHIGQDVRYEQHIARHVHYLYGTNVNGISYVSGFGIQAMSHPHYRPGVADGVEQAVPGMVSGGPNRNLQDEYAKAHLQGKAPAACYVDHEDSYATNEITIYWNSPALFVMSYYILSS